jgi:hypothetical protein
MLAVASWGARSLATLSGFRVDRAPGRGQHRNLYDVPNGSTPLWRTVFGYSPVPQRTKEPKSLHQPPSGGCGSVTTKP